CSQCAMRPSYFRSPLEPQLVRIRRTATMSPMSSARRRRRAVILVVIAMLPVALVLRPYLAFARALTRSTDGFASSQEDARVRYEPGAEAEAAQVAAALPAAIAAVEGALEGRFARPVTVFVCATPASFARFTGGERAAGTTLGGRLFLAPRLASTPERVPRVLAHELSHLYFQQREGIYAFARSFPAWLREGIAVWASGGGGAEGVTEAEAAQAIREGRGLVPDVPGLLPGH